MTNLGYVRDAEREPEEPTGESRYFQPAILNLLEIQTGREIPEAYVLAINLRPEDSIARYIAAGAETGCPRRRSSEARDGTNSATSTSCIPTQGR